MEEPGIFFFETCQHGAIRTLTGLPRDKNNAEDIDTSSEDHAYDDIGYRITTGRRYTKTIYVEAA
jgi:hypothetical protein